MAIGAKHLVLRSKNALDGSHQGATLSCQIRSHFPVKISFKQVARSNTNSQRYYAVFCFACTILKNGVRRVESSTFYKHAS